MQTYMDINTYTHSIHHEVLTRHEPQDQAEQSRDITPHGVPLHQQPQQALLGSNPCISIMLPSPQNIYFSPKAHPAPPAHELCFSPFLFFYQFPTVAGMELLIPLLPLFFCSLFAALFSSCFFIPLKPSTWNNLHLCKCLEGEQFVGH